MKTEKEILSGRHSTPAQMLATFGAAEEVSLDFMTGRWGGVEVFTGHRLNGLLTAAGWYGKEFLGSRRVHPLLLYNRRRTGVFALNPAFVPLWFTPPKWKVLHALLNLARPVMETSSPKAGMDMMEVYGKRTATLIYDDKPIRDHFVRLDDDTLLGLMDRKGERDPFFFFLHRDEEST